MTEGYQNMPKVPVWYTATDTGIAGVTAAKYGNIVQMNFSCNVSASGQGWKEMGQLPTALRSWAQTNFVLYDNGASDLASNVVVDGRITTDGKLWFYVWSDKLSFETNGTLTFITAPGND